MSCAVEIFTEMDTNRKQRGGECEWGVFSVSEAGEKGLRVGGQHVNSVRSQTTESCCQVIYSPCENIMLLQEQGCFQGRVIRCALPDAFSTCGFLCCFLFSFSA